MIYCDTSFLTPLILQEATSDAVAAYISRLPAGDLAISQWVRLEFASLVSREVRMGGLTEPEAQAASREFSHLVSDSYRVITPLVADYDVAKGFIENFATGLRAGDALHLAIARNHGAQAFYTLDRGLLKAAKLVKLPASHGIKV